jgi:hypothetical protein
MGRHHGKHDQTIRPCGGVDSSAFGSALVGIESNFFGDDNTSVSVIRISDTGITIDEIWDAVRKQWEAFTSDVNQSLPLIDKDYLGWFYQDSTPDDKETLGLWIRDSIANRKTELVRISPVGSKIIENVATVNYHYFWVYSSKQGTREQEIGRYTETFRKSGSVWLLINDHGGPTG